MWVAAAPGAGFSETADFLKVFQNEPVQPTWYEKKLWHLYDCTDYALNLFNCPTVAYSGEKDSQKQAADMMAKALKAEGIELAHIIGAKAGHQYTPEAKAEINRRIDASSQRPRPDARGRSLHHLDAPLQPLVLGPGRRPGAALGAGHVSTPTCSAATGDGPQITHEERLGLDARDPCRAAVRSSMSAKATSTSRSTATDDRGAPAALRPLVDGPFPQGRRQVDSRSRRPTTARCASGTACKGRSTTPSWTAS